jgi:hypothetical protein
VLGNAIVSEVGQEWKHHVVVFQACNEERGCRDGLAGLRVTDLPRQELLDVLDDDGSRL